MKGRIVTLLRLLGSGLGPDDSAGSSALTVVDSPPEDEGRTPDEGRVFVGRTYPVIFGNSPCEATVTRIYPSSDTGMRVDMRIVDPRKTVIMHTWSLKDFVIRVKDRALYENFSIDSIAVDPKWLG